MNKKRYIIQCSNCKKKYEVSYAMLHRRKTKGITKCHKCACSENKGSNNYNWKGGVHKARGYVIINANSIPEEDKKYIPEHMVNCTNGNQNRYPEHRFIMAKYLGRVLEPTEQVHHINGIKDDNRIENLELINPHEHTAITRVEAEYKRKIRDLEEEIDKLKEQLNDLVLD